MMARRSTFRIFRDLAVKGSNRLVPNQSTSRDMTRSTVFLPPQILAQTLLDKLLRELPQGASHIVDHKKNIGKLHKVMYTYMMLFYNSNITCHIYIIIYHIHNHISYT